VSTIVTIPIRTDTPGRIALLCVFAEDPQTVIDSVPHYQVVQGQVGTMDVQKIIASIETAARREHFIGPEYAEEHALYHCCDRGIVRRHPRENRIGYYAAYGRTTVLLGPGTAIAR
jgi:hypothetical protein